MMTSTCLQPGLNNENVLIIMLNIPMVFVCLRCRLQSFVYVSCRLQKIRESIMLFFHIVEAAFKKETQQPAACFPRADWWAFCALIRAGGGTVLQPHSK